MTLLPNITADIARENRDKYSKLLENNKYNMLRFWLNRIEEASNQGRSCALSSKFYIDEASQIIDYVNEANEFVPLANVSTIEVHEFFSERGFTIELKAIDSNAYYYIIYW